MKKLITNLKVLMTLLLLCGVSSAWGQTAKIGDILWSEAFSGGSASTTFSETKSLSPGDGTTMLNATDKSLISYEVNNACLTTSSGGNVTGSNLWIKKNTTGYFIVKDIPLYNAKKVKVFWNQGGKTKATCQYAFDSSTSFIDLASTSEAGANISSEDLDVTEHTTISLKWVRTSTDTNLRLDDLKLQVTDIVRSADETYIEAENIDLSSDATSGEIEFTINNPIADTKTTATVEDGCEWISNVTVDNNKVLFTTIANSGAARTATITIKHGTETKEVTVTQAKPTTFATLVALVAAGEPVGTEKVTVTLTDEAINDFFITQNGEKNGIYLMVGAKKIEVFCKNVPNDWVIDGTVSGKLENCDWKVYNGTWELCPTSWDILTYTQPKKYTINIADGIVGGAVSTDPADEAAEGKPVSLIATPNTGYALDAWTVKDEDGNPVTVTDGTFVMPAKAVYVGATFTKAQYLFYESFNTNSGIGGNDGTWSSITGSKAIAYDNDSWAFENANGANQCARFGTGDKKGSATTPVINATGDMTLVFKAAAWYSKDEKTTLNITSSSGTLSTSEITLAKGAWKTYKVYIYDAENPQITISATNAKYNRFFLDEVYVLPYNMDAVEIGPSGYATYSTPNYIVIPDAASGVQLFGAKINDEGTAVTLIPAPEGQTIGLKGAGYIVKATPNTIAFIEQTGENGNDIEGNQLVGTEQSERTLTQGEAYLLSATSDGTPFFGLCNEGTLAPFKAFLPVPAPGVKAILAIEEGGTTGINTIKNAALNIQDAIYNLAGQKVGADYKGIVIRNGKKMLNK